MPHQERQQVELGRSEMDEFTIAVEQTAFDVEFKIAHPENKRFERIFSVQPARYSPQARHQFAKADRFGEVVVRTRLESPHHIILRIAHSDHDNPNLRQERPDLAAGLHSSDSRHVHVEQHQIKWALR